MPGTYSTESRSPRFQHIDGEMSAPKFRILSLLVETLLTVMFWGSLGFQCYQASFDRLDAQSSRETPHSQTERLRFDSKKEKSRRAYRKALELINHKDAVKFNSSTYFVKRGTLEPSASQASRQPIILILLETPITSNLCW